MVSDHLADTTTNPKDETTSSCGRFCRNVKVIMETQIGNPRELVYKFTLLRREINYFRTGNCHVMP